MKRNLVYFKIALFATLIVGCRSTDLGNCYESFIFKDQFSLTLPCYEDKSTETEYHGGQQTTFTFNDGSLFFISNNTDEAPLILSDYLETKQYSSFVFSDSLNYEDQDEKDGSYWRVIKKEDYVAGYRSVPSDRLSQLNQALEAIRKIE